MLNNTVTADDGASFLSSEWPPGAYECMLMNNVFSSGIYSTAKELVITGNGTNYSILTLKIDFQQQDQNPLIPGYFFLELQMNATDSVLIKVRMNLRGRMERRHNFCMAPVLSSDHPSKDGSRIVV
jgi:hypothetical protein